jgi:uncharacterized protein YgiM (DUF1202 family)
VKSSFLEFLMPGDDNTLNTTNSLLYNLDNSSLYESKPSYFTTGTLNLREQMSTSSSILAKIPKGAEVKVIDSFLENGGKCTLMAKLVMLKARY